MRLMLRANYSSSLVRLVSNKLGEQFSIRFVPGDPIEVPDELAAMISGIIGTGPSPLHRVGPDVVAGENVKDESSITALKVVDEVAAEPVEPGSEEPVEPEDDAELEELTKP